MTKRRADILTELIIEHHCQRIAEVGIRKGKTVSRVLSNTQANDVITEYWGIEISSKWYIHAARYMYLFPQFRLLHMSSEEAAAFFMSLLIISSKASKGGYFDLIFIDANHRYFYIKQDLLLWEPLLKQGGVFSGHDHYNGINARHPGVKQAVDEIIGPENIKILPDVMWVRK